MGTGQSCRLFLTNGKRLDWNSPSSLHYNLGCVTFYFRRSAIDFLEYQFSQRNALVKAVTSQGSEMDTIAFRSEDPSGRKVSAPRGASTNRLRLVICWQASNCRRRNTTKLRFQALALRQKERLKLWRRANARKVIFAIFFGHNRVFLSSFSRRVDVRSLCYKYHLSFILKLELIAIRKISLLDSPWKRNRRELGNGLLNSHQLVWFQMCVCHFLTDTTPQFL